MKTFLLVILTFFASAQGTLARSARCDPDGISRWPRLLLIGENHANADSISIRNTAIDSGVQGRIFVGLEGAFPGGRAGEISYGRVDSWLPVSRVYGVDSHLNHGLIFSYFFALGLEYPGMSRREMFDTFVRSLAKNPYMARCWEELRSRGPLEPELERMARNIDSARSIGWGIPFNGEKDFESITAMARLMHARFVSLANSDYRREIGRDKPLDAASLDDLNYLMHGVRDHALAENIADVYCDAAKEGRNMAVSVGDGHVEGIRTLLLEWSGGRLPIETDRSFEAPVRVRGRLEALALMPPVHSPSVKAVNSAALDLASSSAAEISSP